MGNWFMKAESPATMNGPCCSPPWPPPSTSQNRTGQSIPHCPAVQPFRCERSGHLSCPAIGRRHPQPCGATGRLTTCPIKPAPWCNAGAGIGSPSTAFQRCPPSAPGCQRRGHTGSHLPQPDPSGGSAAQLLGAGENGTPPNGPCSPARKSEGGCITTSCCVFSPLLLWQPSAFPHPQLSTGSAVGFSLTNGCWPRPLTLKRPCWSKPGLVLSSAIIWTSFSWFG